MQNEWCPFLERTEDKEVERQRQQQNTKNRALTALSRCRFIKGERMLRLRVLMRRIKVEKEMRRR